MSDTVTSVDVEALDAIILAEASPEWSKVAVFLARITDATRAAGYTCTSHELAERIYAMVDAGSLEAQGNVRRWRAGLVRKWIAGRAAAETDPTIAPAAEATHDGTPAKGDAAAKG